MTDHDQDDLIRARAHQIWQNEGCPEGHEAEHWSRAKAELEAETTQDGAARPQAGDEEGSVPSAVAGPKARKRALR